MHSERRRRAIITPVIFVEHRQESTSRKSAFSFSTAWGWDEVPRATASMLASMVPPSQYAIARSTTLRSSRTFPGHVCIRRRAIASSQTMTRVGTPKLRRLGEMPRQNWKVVQMLSQ